MPCTVRFFFTKPFSRGNKTFSSDGVQAVGNMFLVVVMEDITEDCNMNNANETTRNHWRFSRTTSTNASLTGELCEDTLITSATAIGMEAAVHGFSRIYRETLLAPRRYKRCCPSALIDSELWLPVPPTGSAMQKWVCLPMLELKNLILMTVMAFPKAFMRTGKWRQEHALLLGTRQQMTTTILLRLYLHGGDSILVLPC